MDTSKAVAVIGMGCRFPGANSTDEFWNLLLNVENHIIEVPRERWNTKNYHSSDRNEKGKTYSKHAGFINDYLEWDNEVFGINEPEAEAMDPQHKMALEVTYRALEDAGLTLDDMSGTNTSVFVGTMSADFSNQQTVDPDAITDQTAKGISPSLLSNRISYYLNTHGVSVTSDTACSTGLVGCHLGAQTILTGSSNISICGGVGFMYSPNPFIALSKARMASETGQCQTFTENADGYVRSEGCGIVILKNLDMAKRDGNRIHAVIISEVNSDGRMSKPITNPSSEIQARLVEQTMAKADLKPEQIQFVEMHGTGTPAGDPAEISSIGMTIGASRTGNNKKTSLCPIGSVKTNIGHLEAAAGMAGLVKIILMMKHKTMVPSKLFGPIKKSLNLEENGVFVLQERQFWQPVIHKRQKIRIASVNSFGFGGTNVHMIVQGMDRSKSSFTHKHNQNERHVILFTGFSSTSITQSMSDVIQAIVSGKVSLRQLSFTSLHFRSLYRQRIAVSATSLDELREKLQILIDAGSEIGKKFKCGQETNVIMVFGGMGTHWVNMGKSLYDNEPVYRETIDKLQKLFSSLGNINLKSCLLGNHDLTNPMYGQPVLFACQVALYNLWKSKGIVPNKILGHSVGEVAAAYASGALTLVDAAFVIVHRGKTLNTSSGDGAMLVIGKMPTEDVEESLASFDSNISIAAYNSPCSCTVSGSSKEIVNLQNLLEAKEPQPFLRRLPVSVAYHSSYMDNVTPDLEKVLNTRKLHSQQKGKRIHHISTVTAEYAQPTDFCSSSYWCSNVRKSVLFHKAMEKSLEPDQFNAVIEIGPRGTLKTYLKDIATSRPYEYLISINYENDSTFYSSYAKACELGIIKRLRQPNMHSLVPRYGFVKKYLYKEPKRATVLRDNNAGVQLGSHLFVSDFVTDKEIGVSNATAYVNKRTTNFVFEHTLSDEIIIPGATYAEMGLALVSKMAGDGLSVGHDNSIRVHVTFHQACFLRGHSGEVNLKIAGHALENKAQTYEFDVTGDNILHSYGQVSIEKKVQEEVRILDLERVRSKHNSEIQSAELYDTLAKFNFKYGPSLRCVKHATTNFIDCLVELEVPNGTNMLSTTIHPVILDSVLQSGTFFPSQSKTPLDGQVLPYSIGEMKIFQRMTQNMYIHMWPTEATDRRWKVDATLTDSHGLVLAEIQGITYGLVGKLINFSAQRNCYSSVWKPIVADLAKQNDEQEKDRTLVIQIQGAKEIDNLKLGTVKRILLTSEQIEEIYTEPENFLNLLPPDFTSFKSVLYWACLEQCNSDLDNLTGEAMNEMVLKTNFLLLQFLKLMITSKKRPPVYVITSGVYSLMKESEICPEHPLKAIIGTSLHGMCRSVNREMSHMRVHTVDVSEFNEHNIVLLNKVMSSLCDQFEIVIHNGEILYGTIDTMPKTGQKDQRVLPSNDDAVNLQIEANTGTIYWGKSDDKAVETNSKLLLAMIQEPQNNDPTSGTTKYATTFDAIVETKDEEQRTYHVCEHLEVRENVTCSRQSQLVWELFPCRLPCLSYWVTAWKVLNRAAMGDVQQVNIIIQDGTSKIWSSVLPRLCQLFRIKMVSDYDKQTTKLVVTKNPTDDIVTDSTMKILVIAETFKSSLSPSNYSKISTHHTLNLLSQEKVQKILRKFNQWLDTLDSETILGVLDGFESEVEILSTVWDATLTQSQKTQDNSGPKIVRFEKDAVLRYQVLNPQNAVRPNAGYVVVGGRKGLGWETVKYMVYQGAKHICVIARSAPSEEKLIEGKQLEEKYQCRIIDFQADVCNMAELREVFETFERQSGCPIKGIIYGAAVVSDSIMPTMTKEKFDYALRPKVVGVWNTYLLSKTMDLDFFIMYSSFSSIFGNGGQTNYAAGNAFKNAITALRRINHGVGQSICWGALDLGIIVDNPQARRKLKMLGLIPLKPQEIHSALDHAVVHDLPLASYTLFNWPAFKQTIMNGPTTMQNQYKSLLQHRMHYCRQPTANATRQTSTRENASEEYMFQIVKKIVMLEDQDFLIDSSLIEIGADSQERQQIYGVLMNDIGFQEQDLRLMDIGDMKLQTLIDTIGGLKSKYST